MSDGAPTALVSLIGNKQYKRCARDIFYFTQVDPFILLFDELSHCKILTYAAFIINFVFLWCFKLNQLVWFLVNCSPPSVWSNLHTAYWSYYSYQFSLSSGIFCWSLMRKCVFHLHSKFVFSLQRAMKFKVLWSVLRMARSLISSFEWLCPSFSFSFGSKNGDSWDIHRIF